MPKDSAKNYGKWPARGIQFLFCTTFLYILVVLTAFSHKDYACKRMFFFSNVQLILIWGLVFFLLALSFHFLQANKVHPFQNIHLDYSCIARVLVVILFFFQLYIAYNIFFVTGWDSKYIVDTATLMSNGGDPSDLFPYYSQCSNNIPLLLIYSAIFRVNRLIGFFPYEQYQCMSIVVVNCLISSATCLLTYKSATFFLSKGKSMLCMLVAILSFGLSPWVVICYSDTLCLGAPILCFYLYMLSRREAPKKHIPFLYLVLSIFCGCVGFLIKPQCVVILIAIIMVELLELLQSKAKLQLPRLLLSIVCTAVFCLGIQSSINTAANRCGMDLDPEAKLGWEHIFMMGLNQKTTGTWSLDDVEFSLSYATRAERSAANLNEAIRRIQESGGKGLAEHLIKKMLVTYNDGTFAWGCEGGFYAFVTDPPNTVAAPFFRSIYFSSGSHFTLFSTLEQFLWLGILLLTCCAGIFLPKGRSRSPMLVLMLALIGLTLFEALFEVRARYLYTYVPLFCILSVVGLENISILLRQLTKKRPVL